jgi:hypothetical protein
MIGQRLAIGCVLAGTLAVGFVRAQTSGGDTAFSAQRTPWGHPDLQGVWDYRTITPLERPTQFGEREFYTEEEIVALEGRANSRMEQPPDENTPANLVHAQYMTDPGRFVDDSRRTSLIIDPPNGRMPETVAQGGGRGGFGGGREVDFDRPWESRALLERCISRGLPGALLPGLYNNNILITQSPGFVAITHEMVHETRVVPLDGRELSGLRGYMGESRGYWDGDTLVVETTNFNDDGGYRGAAENLRLIERYTLVGPEIIDFRLTFDDASTWAQPWTAAYSMRPTEGGGIYEYACHEGNYGLRNILENMMIEERARQAAAGN